MRLAQSAAYPSVSAGSHSDTTAPLESGDRARSADGSEIAGYVDIGRL